MLIFNQKRINIKAYLFGIFNSFHGIPIEVLLWLQIEKQPLHYFFFWKVDASKISIIILLILLHVSLI